MAKSYIDRGGSNDIIPSKEVALGNSKISFDNEIVVIEANAEEKQDELKCDEALPWTKNKLRGFKRNITPTKQPSEDSGEISETMRRVSQNNPVGQNRPAVRICHYFANTGRCEYEERTGLNCKFDHRPLPPYHFGINCTRQKCQFSHPKVNRSQNLHNDRGLLVAEVMAVKTGNLMEKVIMKSSF